MDDLESLRLIFSWRKYRFIDQIDPIHLHSVFSIIYSTIRAGNLKNLTSIFDWKKYLVDQSDEKDLSKDRRDDDER